LPVPPGGKEKWKTPSIKKPAEQGLGLVIMEEWAKLAGGSLQVQSRKNKGTAITLKIPDPARGKAL
jgi:sensor histidine kinase regulating citrate/malate metabolism